VTGANMLVIARWHLTEWSCGQLHDQRDG